ncbi:MAG: exodeoxyribonuclease VII small subunit [Phycisphaeraceae bacterium]|nr:exodeoxyribonuclease VII small subunit [Phycisphaeraceae bacterium]
MSVKKSPDVGKLRFEEAIEQLEALIERIESGEIGLEESLQQYEVGAKLIQRCRTILDSAEKKIAELTEGEDGELVEEN